jgi:hypothetical protein
VTVYSEEQALRAGHRGFYSKSNHTRMVFLEEKRKVTAASSRQLSLCFGLRYFRLFHISVEEFDGALHGGAKVI